jgi:hypothetical protein
LSKSKIDKEMDELWDREPKFSIKDPIMGVVWVYENGKGIRGQQGSAKEVIDKKGALFWLDIFLGSAPENEKKKIEDAIEFLKSLKD